LATVHGIPFLGEVMRLEPEKRARLRQGRERPCGCRAAGLAARRPGNEKSPAGAHDAPWGHLGWISPTHREPGKNYSFILQPAGAGVKKVLLEARRLLCTQVLYSSRVACPLERAIPKNCPVSPSFYITRTIFCTIFRPPHQRFGDLLRRETTSISGDRTSWPGRTSENNPRKVARVLSPPLGDIYAR
jgi:hypothetical protein